jgi:hypothetical protein
MIHIPVSPGELLDKISIMEIKARHIKDPLKLKNITHELSLLQEIRDNRIEAETPGLASLYHRLKDVNQAIWDIEDLVRTHEKEKNFGPDFIKTARSVYLQNDLRASLKRQINRLLDSPLIEEKDYVDY